MDRQKKARTPIRASFTRTINEIETELSKDIRNLELIAVKFELLETIWYKLETLDTKVREEMLDADCSEQDLQSEQDAVDTYNEHWISIRHKVQEVQTKSRPVSPTPSVSSLDSSTSIASKRYKLPKIELKKFNGELKDWLSFWSQFEKIHEDKNLHESDKFQYLIQAMATGTRARKLVESYPQSAENYPKVIEALRDRFGDKVLLTEVYVRQLLKSVISNVAKSREPMPLSNIYDELESHLRALESLGVTSDQSAAFLYPLVESSLPEEIIKVWQRSPLSGYEDDDCGKPEDERLKSLMKFLRKEVKGAERLAFVRAGINEPSKEKKTTTRKEGQC